jgi:hypothetical protein
MSYSLKRPKEEKDADFRMLVLRASAYVIQGAGIELKCAHTNGMHGVGGLEMRLLTGKKGFNMNRRTFIGSLGICAAMPQTVIDPQTKNHVTIVPISEGPVTMFGVTVDNARDDDLAIVQIFYWISFPGIETKIVRSSTSVILALDNIRVATDSVPVPLSDIMKVDVKIVRSLHSESFPYRTIR